METFIPKEFNIKNLKGISDKNIEEHLKLYKAYVANANLVLNKINELSKDTETNSYLLAELYRRFAFEFNGVRNHEYFFESLDSGPTELATNSPLHLALEKEWATFENFLTQFKKVALTRGIGWTMLSYDKISEHLFLSWVDEQHLGQLNNTSPILLLDMWEHSFVYDFPTSQKKDYVESFFQNLNWERVEYTYINAIQKV
jgi:superoxide dismutase, Fe-Mn family